MDERSAESQSREQVTLKGYVYEVDYGLGDEKEYVLFSGSTASDDYYTLVGPAEFTYTIPASFNATAAKVSSLEKKREEFYAQIARINTEISKLQAIEYTPEAA